MNHILFQSLLYLYTMQNNRSKYLNKLGITALNPMQTASIEMIESNTDLVLLSPTGSGKTLAFLLPLVDKIKGSTEKTQLLILAPARELAIQIEQVIKNLGTGHKVLCCYGGHMIQTERNSLRHPAEIIVGTPGRIADHVRRGHISTQHIQYLVLDEFDKALELGFHQEMRDIIGQLKELNLRILTSATNMQEIPSFVRLRKHKILDFLPQEQLQENLSLKAVRSEGKDKLEAFFSLVCILGNEPMVVFVNHREAADRISKHLHEMGLAHDLFHGGLKQEERERALIKFRNGSHHLLLTTDLASRGLDIPDIKYVIHYHLPKEKEAFIHRNGRTARMKASGTAYLILAEQETLPEYIEGELQFEALNNYNTPPSPPQWQTIYLDHGKKDKINKIDIVGLFLKKGKLKKDELGLIDVLDHSAYIAVERKKVKQLINLLQNEKIKGKKLKIRISR
ncbi:DEAD/DEAH box helicase [Saccharicrinis fermentans]|uniref:ATP-dependent RNA helicase DbpA n=1 Tax=Saccharicrinis fermentans DSM 9555 = JCM 21142 TaxID=869213 RepID=W7XWU9_9BACT|nr:DEAD/DEAH box helicase [Saccharicrinis fermentans]GAF02855.1 ATP-dependent RNA helicase DbpA [Saccharicrinis fermentans DSM 9555 = JCM 21142]